MKKLPALLLAALLPCLLIASAPGCAGGGDGDGDGDDDENRDDHPALALTGDGANGESVFATNCASCHGVDALGGSGPDLSGEVPEKSDNSIAWIIEEGEEGMPAIDITDQEIADVIAFLRAEFPN